jgi:uncharacterized protein (DUF427 family)
VSLTLGSGPLAGKPGGKLNFSLDGAPAHRILFEAYPRRMRALVGDRVVLDSVRARLLHETGIPPRLYVPFEDLDAAVLERTTTTTHCPFKGDASYWTLRVGDRVEADAVWAYEAPLPAAGWLAGYASLYWEKADAWLVESDHVHGRLRDPYHRVDVHDASRPARVRIGGTVVAATERAKLLFETGLAPRVYVPAGDVAAGVLSPAERRTSCPYKGDASYWDATVDGKRFAGAAWSYEAPLAEAARIEGHVCFDGEGIETVLDPPAARFTMGP